MRVGIAHVWEVGIAVMQCDPNGYGGRGMGSWGRLEPGRWGGD